MRFIDHVYVPTARARDVAALLRDSLGLPEVWPFASRGGSASTGLSLGNVVLEILDRPGQDGLGIEGIALWPGQGTDAARAQLRRAGLAVGLPVRTPSRTRRDAGDPAPAAGSGWVLTGLGDFPEGNVFLCEYLEADVVAASRRRGAAALDAAGGGVLGLRGVREVVVTARDAARQRERWRALTFAGGDPTADTGAAGDAAVQSFVSGPAVRVEGGDRDAIVGLVLVVRDVAAAQAAWPEELAGLGVSFVAGGAQ